MKTLIVGGDDTLSSGLADGLRSRAVGGLVHLQPDATSFGGRAAVGSAVGGAIEQLGGLDLLVHTWTHPAALEECVLATMSEHVWEAAAETSLYAAIHTAQTCFAPLRDSGRGRIVFTMPTIGTAGGAGFAPLASVAEGVRQLGKALAKQWGKYAITVNMIQLAPGMVLAGAAGGAGAAAGERLSSAISLSVPALGSAGDPARDLAPVVALLASDDAHFATGATITLDGGIWMAQ